MSRKIKQLLAKIIIVSMLISFGTKYMEIYVIADEKLDGYKAKIVYECTKERTLLTQTKECKLNEKGIFDEEINELPYKDRKALMNADESNIQVSVSYTNIVEDSKSGNINAKELSLEQLDVVMQNKYEKDIKDVNESGFKKLCKKLNLINDVYAAAITTSEKAEGGVLKQCVILSQSSSKRDSKGNMLIHVIYIANWIDTPTYTYEDCCSIMSENLTIISGSESAEYTVTKDWTQQYLGSFKTEYKSLDLATDLIVKSDAIGVSCDLYDNKSDVRIMRGYEVYPIYTYHKIVISYDAKVKNRKRDYVSVYGEYYHNEVSSSFSPSFSIGSEGISFGGSFSKSKEMVAMTPNPYISEFVYK